jgi:hypothetical protein
MDVNDIVCCGFGSWSNANSVVTLGYGCGTAVSPPEGIELAVWANHPEFRVPLGRPQFAVPWNHPEFSVE